MFGNTNQPIDVMVQTGHLFAPMPDVIRDDMAFIDRIHYYLPGWEVPRCRNEHVHRPLRVRGGLLRRGAAGRCGSTTSPRSSTSTSRSGAHLNARDRKAVRKTVSGLMKIIYPHGKATKDRQVVDDDVPLTRREQQVLRHVALGLSNREIGRSLEISVETVKEHVQNILRKIAVSDRTQAAVWAVRKELGESND